MTSADDLYGLPLDRFIPERTSLVKTLRAEGNREEAAAVAARRKPSVAAWAVNQLIRTQTEAVGALLSAGDDLASAQEGAVGGQSTAEALRDAARRQREALDQLADAAKGLLDAGGAVLSPATLNQVTDTLRAAALDDHARRQVASGCLTKEIQFAGLGMGDWTTAAPSDPPPAKPQAKPQPTPKPAKPDDAARRRAERQAEEERLWHAAVKSARSAEKQARSTATQAVKKLEVAQTKHEAAVAALKETERALDGAQQHAGTTADELRTAEATVQQLVDAKPRGLAILLAQFKAGPHRGRADPGEAARAIAPFPRDEAGFGEVAPGGLEGLIGDAEGDRGRGRQDHALAPTVAGLLGESGDVAVDDVSVVFVIHAASA